MGGVLLIHAIPLCVSLASFALAAIVLTARQHRAEHWWMAGLATVAGLWGVFVNLFLMTNDLAFGTVMVHSYYVVAALIPLCLLELSIVFPVKHAWTIPGHLFLLLGTTVALAISIAPFGVAGSVHVSPTHTVSLNYFYYFLYVIYFIAYVLAAAVLFIRSDRLLGRKKHLRRQLRVMIVGMAVALACGSFFNLILPITREYAYIWAGPPFTILFVVAAFYSIIKQGLFDLRATLARTTAYFLLLCSLIILYGLVVFGITNFFFAGKVITDTYATILVIVALAVSFTYAPLKHFIDKQTHRLFYRDEYDIREVTEQLSTITAREIEMRGLIKHSLELLDTTLAPTYIVAYVTGTDGHLHRFNGSMHHPTVRQQKVHLDVMSSLLDGLPRIVDTHEIMQLNSTAQHKITSSDTAMILQFLVQQERIGALFIGEKQNGRPYDSKDMQLLSTVVDELALAIQNSQRFAEIQQFNATLKGKIADATKKLRRTNRELQKLDEAKDEFVSMASHQLRTPLTSIKGYISMVMEGDAGQITDQQRHLLNEAFVSSERMVRLIADFLSVSRLQTGKFIIDRTPVDLDAMIKREVATLRTIAASHGQKIEYAGPATKKVLQLDEAKISQVIMNFCDNAIYYSKANSVIHVDLTYTRHDAVLSVYDTGIGVPLAEQDKLFGKFFRASNARMQRPDGTGVGLYLAKKIVASHGGTVLFSSKEGRGSMFGFKLPLN